MPVEVFEPLEAALQVLEEDLKSSKMVPRQQNEPKVPGFFRKTEEKG